MHLAETDAAPLAFGPLSLRKWHHLVPFDPVHRCRRLATWYREHGLFPEGGRCIARARLQERE